MRIPDTQILKHPPKKSKLNLFFTGGYDSSFRLAWLVLVEHATVQPIYCLKIDTRENQAQEIAAQNDVVKSITAISGDDLILPTRLVSVIPKKEEIDLPGRTSVGRFGSASQYRHLARYTLLEDIVVELGLNLISPNFKWPYSNKKGFRNFLTPHLVGEGSECRVRDSDTPYLQVFRNLRFPLVRTTKEQMWALAIEHGFEGVLLKTFSCWHPKDGKACGDCFNCKERFLKGT